MFIEGFSHKNVCSGCIPWQSGGYWRKGQGRLSIELIAILATAAFQSLLLAGVWIYTARIARSLDGTIRGYGAGNLRSTMKLEEELRRVEDYVRTHSAEIDRFIREFERRFAPQQ
jgi:hypothetical protein